MVSSTSVEQSQAITTSIEETHASKQQGQSSTQMNYPSEEFIPIDKRKWNDIPAVDNVKRESLARNISKRFTVFVRHREVDEPVHWSSLLLVLRRDFEREGARTFSDSRWRGYIHRGNTRPRCQYCVESNNNLLYDRAIQDLIDPELLIMWRLHQDGKKTLCHVGSSCTVNSILQAGLIAGGKDTEKGRQTVFFTPSDPIGVETEEECDDLTETTKSLVQGQAEIFFGCNLLGQ